MNFLALNDDVKSIIASHLASDLKIRSLLSKNHGIQKILFNEVVYIGSTCDTLKKCMSKFNIKSNSKVNYLRDKFYMMIHSSYINYKIELIENFPCNNEEELKNRKNEIYDKLKKIKNKK